MLTNGMLPVLSPLLLCFFAIVVGLLVGRIRVFGLSLGVAGVLVASIVIGCAASQTKGLDWESCQQNLSFLSQIGTAMFVSSIGAEAGLTMPGRATRKWFFGFLLGVMMTAAAFGVSWTIGKLDSGVSPVLLKGILCGAMTSTPALSAVSESVANAGASASAGYSCSYPLGVMLTVLFVQAWSRKTPSENRKPVCLTEEPKSSGMRELWILSIAVVIGSVLGKLPIPVARVPLGNTGGILISAMAAGLVVKKASLSINRTALSVLRTAGLVLFFVANGLPAGVHAVTSFRLTWIAYGAWMTGGSLLVGRLLAVPLLRKRKDALCAVAGGMTSTPALGTLQNSGFSLDVSVYSAAYMGALLSACVGMKIL